MIEGAIIILACCLLLLLVRQRYLHNRLRQHIRLEDTRLRSQGYVWESQRSLNRELLASISALRGELQKLQGRVDSHLSHLGKLNEIDAVTDKRLDALEETNVLPIHSQE